MALLLAAPAARAQVQPPTPDASIAAFNVLESWVRAWAVPDQPAQPKGLETMGGCAVTLRLDHHVVARVADFESGPAALVNAAKAALADAEPHLPVGHDALAAEQLKEAAGRLTISLELAGPLIPIKPEKFVDVDAELQPGLDGIAARFGNKIAGTFPAAMLSMTTTPSDALASAISEASGDPKLAIRSAAEGQPGKIAEAHQATYYKFRVAHVVQLKENAAPTFLFRGGRVVQPNDVSTASLRTFADELAANLQMRAKAAGGQGMAGTYIPALGRFEPAVASPIEQTLAAAALAEYAGVALKADVRTCAADLLDDLLAEHPPRLPAWQDPVTAAAWLVSDFDLRRAGAQRDVDAQIRARLGAAVAGAFDQDTGWSGVPEGGRAIVALALVIEAQDTGPAAADKEARTKKARAAIDSIYNATAPAKLVAHMPWLGRAELLLTEPEKPIPAAAALRDMREKVWDHQLRPSVTEPEGEPDLTGGIIFTSARNPLPSWQSVRPVIFLAQMAGEPRLTDQKEFLRELSRLLASMRFLRQLTVDDAAAYSADDPAAAVGGVRSSLWDQRQPVEATALTLMAVCDLLRTLEHPPK